MRYLNALAAGFAVLLAGCGGGSGGGNVRSDATSELPVFTAAAQRLGGLSAPTFTAAQLEAHEKAILARADTFVLSDWLYVNPDAQTEDDVFFPATVRCVEDTCYQAAIDGTGNINALTVQSLAAEASQPRSGYQMHPVGQRSGVKLAATTDEGGLYSSASYGGWLDYSAFGVNGILFTGGELEEWILLYAYSYGEGASSTNPAAGTATWTGIMTGVDVSVSETTGNTIQGQARIDFDLEGELLPTLQGDYYYQTVDIAFTQVYDLDAATRRPDMRWNRIRVEDGSFSTVELVSGRIEGRFYGPNHEEVGGVFESRGSPSYSYNIIGAFGASRE